MSRNHNDPTTENQLRRARELTSEELMRHASVSRDNRHRCNPDREEICFCCAALTVLEERRLIKRVYDAMEGN